MLLTNSIVTGAREVIISAAHTVVGCQDKFWLQNRFFFNNLFSVVARRVTMLAATGFWRVKMAWERFSYTRHRVAQTAGNRLSSRDFRLKHVEFAQDIAGAPKEP